ncbi:MAG: hypothetical protein ABIM21_04925 [candidate division WOR-3 bacterium]
MFIKRYEQYVFFEVGASPLHLPGTFPGCPLFYMDGSKVKGGFYFECVWFVGPTSEKDCFKPHYHDFDEYVGMVGSNANCPQDLGGEVEFWIEDEKYIITKSCIIFIPKGVSHTPVIIRKLHRPILFFSMAPVEKYTLHVSNDPRWSHLKDPPKTYSNKAYNCSH